MSHMTMTIHAILVAMDSYNAKIVTEGELRLVWHEEEAISSRYLETAINDGLLKVVDGVYVLTAKGKKLARKPAVFG